MSDNEQLIDLQDVPDPFVCPVSNRYDLGLVFNTEKFFWNLSGEWRAIDAMTFTWTLDWSDLPMRRLMLGNWNHFRGDVTKDKIRMCPKLHTKLYLCFNKRTAIVPDVAWVGSLNIVKPTMHDIMIRVDDKPRLRVLANYFNEVWRVCGSKISY